MSGLGRRGERPRQNWRAHHFIERERVGNLGRGAQRNHQVGENWQGAPVTVVYSTGKPRRRSIAITAVAPLALGLGVFPEREFVEFVLGQFGRVGGLAVVHGLRALSTASTAVSRATSRRAPRKASQRPLPSFQTAARSRPPRVMPCGVRPTSMNCGSSDRGSEGRSFMARLRIVAEPVDSLERLPHRHRREPNGAQTIADAVDVASPCGLAQPDQEREGDIGGLFDGLDAEPLGDGLRGGR